MRNVTITFTQPDIPNFNTLMNDTDAIDLIQCFYMDLDKVLRVIGVGERALYVRSDSIVSIQFDNEVKSDR